MKKRSLSLGLFALILATLPLNVIATPINDDTSQSSTISSETNDANESNNNSESSPSDVVNDDKQGTDVPFQSDVSNAINDTEVTDNLSTDEKNTKSDEQEKAKESQNETKTAGEVVMTVEELATQIKDPSVSEITLGADLFLAQGKFPVKHDLTIIGNGHTITYGVKGGGGMAISNGIYFAKSGITITFKDVNFGKPDVTGDAAKVNANNWYGIAPALDDKHDITLVVENINYYSNYGSQPFHLAGDNAKLILKGSNTFERHSPAGSYGEEFLEGSNIEFAEGSETIINSDNLDEGGIIYGRRAPINMTIEDNATVKINATQDLFWTNKRNNSLTLGANATLDFNQQYETQPTNTTGMLMGGAGKSLNIVSGENSVLNIRTPNASEFSELTVDLGVNTKTSLTTGQNRIFTDSSKTDFKLDNIEELSFKSENPGKAPNIIGSTGKLEFNEFSSDVSAYSTFINGQLDKPLFKQNKNDSWTLDKKSGITINTITDTEKSDLNEATQILIKKDEKDEGLLEFKSVTPRLNWTNRLINESKGILERDKENELEIVVSDTRFDSNKSDWKIVANVEAPADFKKFSLIWKNKKKNEEMDLNGATILKKSDALLDNDTYTKTWASNEGVLLKSDNYLSIGDYSNQLKITWTICDADMNVE